MTVSLRPPDTVMPVPIGPGRRRSRRGRVGVVVVVDVVVDEHPARVGVGDRADAVVRAVTVLRRRGVAAHLGVRVQPVLVVVELRVLDDDGPTRVRPRVAECVVLHPGVVDRDVAHLLAGAHVHARVVHVVGVELVPTARALGVRGEHPVAAGGVERVVRSTSQSGRCRCSPSCRSCRSRRRRSTRSRCRRRRNPVRKLQTVRFSISTLLAFHTTMPCDDPPASRRAAVAPRSWSASGRSAEQVGEPGLVPSTITVLRFIPRRMDVRRGDEHPPHVAVGGLGERSGRSRDRPARGSHPGATRIQSPRWAAFTAA